jgi:altronate hydrolase
MSAGMVIVSLGCESFDREGLRETVAASGRPVELLVIQETGGTAGDDRRGHRRGRARRARAEAVAARADGHQRAGDRHGLRRIGRAPAASPPIPRSAGVRPAGRRRRGVHLRGDRRADRLRDDHGAARVTPALGEAIEACVAKAERYYTKMGFASFAPGNADGGLTTIEEKSMGAYSKSGSSPICGHRQARRPAARRRASTCSMWCPMASRASASPTSPTMPRSSS